MSSQTKVPRRNRPALDPRAPETIETLVDLAVISLSPVRGATFTWAEVAEEATSIGGPGYEVSEADARAHGQESVAVLEDGRLVQR